MLLNVLPFSFDVGLNQLSSAITVGAELVILDSWLPGDILHTAASPAASAATSRSVQRSVRPADKSSAC